MKLFNGDCLSELAKIENNSIDCVMTDPPYGIAYKSNKQRGDTHNGKEVKVRDEFYFAETAGDKTLPVDYLSIVFDKLKDNTAMYAFCQWSKWSELETAVKRCGFLVKNMIVINKSNHGMGDVKGQYAPKHELLMYATKGRHILDNSQLGRGCDVFNGKVLFSGSVRRHPNEKPVAWLEPFIRRSCPVGGIVLDPFMGSGSTGIACLNTKRDFIGIEIDKKFFEEANIRLVSHIKTLQSSMPEILEK